MKLRYKGWMKLTCQIGLLSISMIAISFFTETDVWLEHFNTFYLADECLNRGDIQPREHVLSEHYRWNYIGIVYVSYWSYILHNVVRKNNIITQRRRF